MPERWVTVGSHPTRAAAARQGGDALAGSVAASGADAVQVRVVTDVQLRRESPGSVSRARRDLARLRGGGTASRQRSAV